MLTPVFRYSDIELKRIEHQLGKLSKILIHIPVNKNIILQEAPKAALARAAYNSALNNVRCRQLPADQILDQVQNDLQLHHEIMRNQELEQHFSKREDAACTADLLGEACRYFELTTNDINLFSFSGNNLFARQGQSGKEEQVKQLFAYLNDQENQVHPLIMSWILHIELVKIAPFTEDNDKVARAMQYHYLSVNKLVLGGFLHLPIELYFNKKQYYDLLEAHRNKTDYTEWVKFGMQVFQANLNRIEGIFKNIYRLSVDYQSMPPRQRNQLNYIFDRAFEYDLPPDVKLSSRQQKIMDYILHKGSISTRELVEVFDCNRKTIQRDFNELLEYRLVSTSGNGSALKYTLNMKDNGHAKLESLQTIQLEGSSYVPAELQEEPKETRPANQQALLF